ncbi:MAG: CBS domain-containing protein [Nitrospiraceae bacterium]|nr:CBS domain-containing protein [Nitrospiraceae bacterium]
MATVKEVIGDVEKDIISLDMGKTVADAVSMLVENEVGALVVIDADGKPVGMFTERDVLKCWTRKGDRHFNEIKVSEVMTTNLIIGESDDDLCYVTTIMIKNRIRHLPILEKNKLVAMLSIRDVVKAQVTDLRAENHYLKDYISDKYPG